ncbi:NUDIX hydrolase [Riemerella anatipestifer]|nr:NUDIX hydrolase [Riemerella anatipestifer]MCO4304540.1 NUDIX hydrolase [Riemerella anatipestifer]MCO7353314.1 NUDIX hydrolase [Riemerella anatipestifer]MCQ4040203.1 NUDIX hydrolase [Riemerella anatipestifer]MCT6761514.1 NUDIX hydrolase [Riemerella anatipestifer]MCT6765592.1 NUDIX hydrolase [Riemerella anatipestifer]
MKIDKINIRVYGICLNSQSEILALEEKYIGEDLTKLPGGGLEYGEGLLDCLQREFREELNLTVKSAQHFYTQEDFLVSKFRDNEQLLTVYYLVEIENLASLKIKEPSIENIKWVTLKDQCPFKLPIDQRVFEQLKHTLTCN